MSFTKPEWAWQALEARIAELEAENKRLTDENHSWRRCSKTWKPTTIALRERAEAAEARIAAVIELCDTDEQGYDWSCFVSDVRAAATGDTHA